MIRAAYGIYYAQGKRQWPVGWNIQRRLQWDGRMSALPTGASARPLSGELAPHLPAFSPKPGSDASFIGAGSASASYSSLIALDKTDTLWLPTLKTTPSSIERQLPGVYGLVSGFCRQQGHAYREPFDGTMTRCLPNTWLSGTWWTAMEALRC